MSRNQKYYPWIALQQYTELSSPSRRAVNPKLHGTVIPDVPLMPTTLLRLEKLFSASVLDLAAISAVIRGDLGLTIHLLRLSGEEQFESADTMPSVEGIVVHAGIEKLKALIAGVPVLSEHPAGEAGVNACARFWMHSHLIALIAQELAVGEDEITPEEAFLAGLLRQIGKLPILLGWRIPELEASDLGELGYALAQAWNFPSPLASVIRGHEEALGYLPSYSLWKIATSAAEWVQLMELMLGGEGNK
ncbi:MAG TPA: HDOD domain-containing protein [Terriglobales bacterium]|nr:HDOD domain-containing protein [Terriglobales bacterium]